MSEQRVQYSVADDRQPATVRFDRLDIDQWFRAAFGYYEGAYIKKSNSDIFPNAVRVNDRVAVWLTADTLVTPLALDTISFDEAA